MTGSAWQWLAHQCEARRFSAVQRFARQCGALCSMARLGPATLSLAMMPLLVFGVVAVIARPRALDVITPRVVMTEGVRAQRADTTTFRTRWAPVSDLVPAIEVRRIVSPLSTADAVELSARAPRRSAPARPLITQRARLDVCARHRMKRVEYTRPNGWRYWRCRK